MTFTASVSIFDEIDAGIWDEGLEALAEAVQARRRFVRDAQGARNKLEFAEGTHVRLINISPKYLVGITGMVNKRVAPHRSGDIMVDIDPHCYHRLGHRYGHRLSIPASSLEEV